MIRIELVEHGIPTEARAFDQPAVRIGRDPNNDMVVAQPYVSARQGEIRVRSGEVVFQGRATTNPTLLRRHGRLTTLDADSGYRTALRDGDELLFGDDRQAVHLVVHLDARASLLAPPPAAVERAWPAISSSPPTLSSGSRSTGPASTMSRRNAMRAGLSPWSSPPLDHHSTSSGRTKVSPWLK